MRVDFRGRFGHGQSFPGHPRLRLSAQGLTLAGVLVVALFAARGAPASPTPSPADWRDQVIYQVITDRFQDGDPANDAIEGNYAPADGYKIHGGDFAGLTTKLDYFANLGVDALWISPVVLNASAEYHGYAARDFFAIAPHFGTLAELRGLAQAAHARGIRIILDVVCNHMGTLVTGSGGGWPAYKYPAGYTLQWANPSKRYYGVFDDLAKFHNYGSIGSWTDPEQVLGELFDLDDLKTEDATVRSTLLQAAQWLVDSTDCDGFRIDTVKHVEMGFWDAYCPGVHAYAASVGKARFFLFGESFDGDDVKVGSYTGTKSGGNYKFDSMLYYPMYYTANGVFLWDDPPSNIPGRYGQLAEYDSTTREQLATFLDNHDNARFLRAGPSSTVQDESRLRTALGWLLTARGVPVLYYGTEQEFDGGGDPYCREDMWDGQWDFGPSDGDNFDEAHPLFQWVQKLTATRRRHEALRRGTTSDLYAESSGPGLYVYQRATATDTALVAVNTSNAPVTRTVQPAWAAGTMVADALDPAVRDTLAGLPASFALKVPARGVRVIESLAAQDAAAAAAPLRVETIFPGHDQSVNDLKSPLRVVFDRDVDGASLESAFQLSPAASGFWQVQGRVARYLPYAPWTAGTIYGWSLDTTLRALDGRRLAMRFDARFRTTSYATGVSVPAGYVVDRIARQGLVAPEGLLPAPWLGPDVMLLSDVGRDRVFTLTPGGDYGHWLGDSRWGRPEGLARTSPDAVVVADQNGLYAVDHPRRMTTQTLGSSVATQTGAVAVGGPGFNSQIYLCDPSADRVARVSPISTLQTFATGVKGGEGLAFGPGGAWGADLYVADCDLPTLGTTAAGPGRIARISPAGAVTTLVQDASLLGGASALAFDVYGYLGGDLFVADILTERILRVTSAGQVSVFATGFKNLAGSGCLAFGADGALYVADPGSGDSFSNSGGTSSPSVFRIARDQQVVDVPRAVGGALDFASPAPNPARGWVTLRFTLPEAGAVRLALYDLAGRRVAALLDGALAAGAHEARWEGTDAAGRPAAAGLYFARLEAAGRVLTRRVAIVK